MPNTKEISKVRVLLSKENKGSVELGETSFRVYYGARGATVPFMWESQPGTPKHPLFNKSHVGNDNFVPPLTPPPSYTSSLALGNNTSKTRKQRFFDVIFSSISRKNSYVTPTSSLSSSTSWSTSSSSSSSLSSPHFNRKKHKSHRRSISLGSTRARSPLFSDRVDNDVKSPSSAMCFGFKK